MPGGVANLLDNHTFQILDKNQDDLNFSYNPTKNNSLQASFPSSLLLCAALV